MDLKLIVLDIDGTLLNSEKIMTPHTRDKLIEAQERGIKVALASGRPTRGMLSLAEELEMNRFEGFLVSYNGAVVYDVKTKETMFKQGLSIDLTNRILQHLSDFDVMPMIDHKDYMYVKDAYFDIGYPLPAGYRAIVEYEVRGGQFKVCEVDDYAAIIKEPVPKILVAGNPDYLVEHYEEMTQPFREETTFSFSAPFYFEFTDLGIDKARALQEIFPEIGIQAENTIAFGDGQNDRSIIEYAGLGVAMGNAMPEILEIADETTTTNDEEGIVEVLNRFF